MEKEMGRVRAAKGGNEGEVGKCDLKAGHERPSSSTFDRTRAWRKWCNGFCVRTYRVSSTASVPECVLCWVCRGRTYHGKVERSARGCVLAGVLQSNSPRRGQTQRAECGRTYISTFERSDPK
jgi:hypothetical protein